MMKSMLAAAIGSLALMGAPALADQLCKDVKIKVTNDAYDEIRVTKINYRDAEDKKWRDNNLKNDTVKSGKTKTFTETLEYVGNEEIPRFQVKFDYKRDASDDWTNGVWSNISSNGVNPCQKNSTISISVTGTADKK